MASSSRPRLWMVFAAVAAVALLSLLVGLSWVRIYDDQLIRQTESELIAQAAVVAEAFAAQLRGRVGPDYGRPRSAQAQPVINEDGLAPILPSLRASSEVLPPPGDPPASAVPPDAEARRTGEALGPLLKNVRRTTLAGLRVVDLQGVLVASSGTPLGTSYAERDEVQRALRGEPVASLRRRLRDPSDAPLQSLSRNAGVRVSVALEEGPVARRILDHLGLPSAAPVRAPARDPPDPELPLPPSTDAPRTFAGA